MQFNFTTPSVLLCCSLLLTSLLYVKAGLAATKIEWCLDDFPNRHQVPATGEPYGPTVDFMKEVARRANLELHLTPATPFARCLRMMEQGKTDLMTSLNTSPQRERYMHLIPYDHARPEIILLRKGSNDILSLTELNHVSLMVIRGYSYNIDLPNIINQHRRIIEIDSLESGLNMLLLNRADALLAPVQSSHNLILSNGRYHDQFKKASLTLQLDQPRFVHIGLSKNSPNANLDDRIRQAVESMVSDDLVHRYFYFLPETPNDQK